MHIVLDKQKMHLQVICGILEKYEPNDSIQQIEKEVSELRDLMDRFMDKIVEPRLMNINKKIAEENDKHIVKEQQS